MQTIMIALHLNVARFQQSSDDCLHPIALQCTVWVQHKVIDFAGQPINCMACKFCDWSFIHSQWCTPAGCATVAEVRKRGDDFWGEFEFYLSDLVVGCVLDCVLVGLLAPAAVIGAKPKTKPSGQQHVLHCFAVIELGFGALWICLDGPSVLPY